MVVVMCGLVLFLGLAFLMLRRRNEILQNFLTPEDPDLEQEFFRLQKTIPEEALQENVIDQPDVNEQNETPDKNDVRWGVPNERAL